MPTGGPTAQVCPLGPKVGGRLLALFCIHRVNRVLQSHDDSTINIILMLLLLLLLLLIQHNNEIQ